MKVYILDMENKNLQKILLWLKEDKRVNKVDIFEDYMELVKQVENSVPDICIIRLGDDGIPGFKTAFLVQQISSDINIIFISNDNSFAVYAYEVGARGYILCPVDKEKFQMHMSLLDHK